MEKQTVSNKALAFEQMVMRKRLDIDGKLKPGMTDAEVKEEYDKQIDESKKRFERERKEQAEIARAEMEKRAQERRAEHVSRCSQELIAGGKEVVGLSVDEILAAHQAMIDARNERSLHIEHVERSMKRFASSGCPERHANNTADEDLKNEKWISTRDKLFDKWRDGFLISLLGIRGNGKTQMAVSVIEKVCKDGGTARYVKALDFFREIRGTFRKDATKTEDEVIDVYANVGILVIDECHQRGHSDFEQNTLINLIDRRYDAGKATILIANQNKEEFAAAMGDSVVSRIHETGCAIVCDWPSFRKPGAWA